VRLPSLISRFDTQSRGPFGVPEMVQIAEPESTRDDAYSIATGIVIMGRVKTAAEDRRPDAV
jgi:hypothetical protein